MPTPNTGKGPGFDTPLPTGGATVTPTTPPRGTAGSATELRRQRDAVLREIQKIQGNPEVPADPSTPGSTAQLSTKQQQAVDSLMQQATTLSKDIQDFESTPQRAPSVRENVNPGPDVPYIQTLNPDGTITVQTNANYTGQIKPVVEHIGNHEVVITPPTAEERAQNPNAQPHITVAYTDKDAQALADRQTAVAESNARVAQANQELNDFATRTKMEIDQAVARGEDAASLRAQRALDLQEKYQAAQIAATQAQTAQAALNEYNTNRHYEAQESLAAQQIQATKDAQAAQDQVTQRGQDITALMTPYTQEADLAKQRLSSGTSFAGNLVSQLSPQIGAMNRDLPPGSDLGGRALGALFDWANKFYNTNLAGPTTAPSAPALPPRTGGPAGSQAPAAPPDLGALFTNAGVSTPAAPPPNSVIIPGGYQGAPNPNVFGSGTGNAPPSLPLSPDGTSMASVADVARAMGRAA